MNLLYLTIIIPLLSFLLLLCLGRNIRIENAIAIGISTVGLLSLLMIFVAFDYSINSVPESSLIYTRLLWEWFAVGSIKIAISLCLDGLSLVFLITIAFLALILYVFAAWYFTSAEDIRAFFAYGNLLIASLFLLVLADNLFVLFVGWESVSLSCYLLIGIYHRATKAGFSAVRWLAVNYITDAFLLIGIFLFYNELHTLNIREILSLANENLAVDSEIVSLITVMLFVGVIGRIGLFPFHFSFSETSIATMPAATLLQSFTIVLSGGYLILRLSSFFVMSSDIITIMGVIAGITIIFANCISLVQNDIKRLVTYINLGQVSYIFFAFVTQNWILSLNFVISYSVTSALLLLSTALLIKACNGERDIHKLGGLFRHYPLLYCCFLLSAASLCAMPWVMSAFYTKGDIIWGLMMKNKMGLGTVALIGILLSTLSVLRLIFTVFHHKQKLNRYTPINKLMYSPLIILAIISTAIFVYIPLPIDGIIPAIDLDTTNQLALQLLLAAVTILAILISYILFCHPNSEIHDIANAPIAKMLMRFLHNEWYFERMLQFLIIRPYIYIAQLVKKDPLSKWSYPIGWAVKKINFQIVPLENGRLRWYMMSIVMGSIMILLLLILI